MGYKVGVAHIYTKEESLRLLVKSWTNYESLKIGGYFVKQYLDLVSAPFRYAGGGTGIEYTIKINSFKVSYGPGVYYVLLKDDIVLSDIQAKLVYQYLKEWAEVEQEAPLNKVHYRLSMDLHNVS